MTLLTHLLLLSYYGYIIEWTLAHTCVVLNPEYLRLWAIYCSIASHVELIHILIRIATINTCISISIEEFTLGAVTSIQISNESTLTLICASLSNLIKIVWAYCGARCLTGTPY
jgi:hypothetical protein